MDSFAHLHNSIEFRINIDIYKWEHVVEQSLITVYACICVLIKNSSKTNTCSVFVVHKILISLPRINSTNQFAHVSWISASELV